MRELTNGEIQILQRHAKWLESGGTDGESADLRNANLCGATWTFLAGCFGAAAKTSKPMTGLLCSLSSTSQGWIFLAVLVASAKLWNISGQWP